MTATVLLVFCAFTNNMTAQSWEIGYPNAEDVIATLHNGTLTISGEGAMSNYGFWNFPWYEHRDDITDVIIENGVTSISEFAFTNIHLQTVHISASVEQIGWCVFGWNLAQTFDIYIEADAVPQGIEGIFCEIFGGIDVVVYVPFCSMDDYRDALGGVTWLDFEILPIPGSNEDCDNTGISTSQVALVQLFPNPAKDEIFIKSELPITQVEIYSLTGSLLLLKNNFNGKISLTTLPQSAYLLKVYTDKGVVVSKIIKE